VLRSIEAHGYRPDRYGTIKGYFLVDDSWYRFVVVRRTIASPP
jgi:hypothetical protein